MKPTMNETILYFTETYITGFHSVKSISSIFLSLTHLRTYTVVIKLPKPWAAAIVENPLIFVDPICYTRVQAPRVYRVLAQHDLCLGWLEKIWYSSGWIWWSTFPVMLHQQYTEASYLPPVVGKLLLKSSWVTLLQLLVKVTRYF